MENLLVIILKTEAVSSEAYRELLQLERQDHLDLLEAVVVTRDRDGRLATRESPGNTLTQIFAGTLVGEPPGDVEEDVPVIPSSALRVAWNEYRMGVSEACLADLTDGLPRGTTAILAHVLEERTLRVDRRMEKYAASLLRIPV